MTDLASLMADEPEYDQEIQQVLTSNCARNRLRAELRPLLEAREQALLARIDRELVHLRKGDGALCGHHPGYMSTMRITDELAEVVCKPCFDLTIEALLARVAELADFIKAFEWSDTSDHGNPGWCPCCGEHYGAGHAPDCELRATLEGRTQE